MADTKISALTAASALTGSEELPLSDGTSTTKACTATQIRDFVHTQQSDGVVPLTQWIRASANRNLTNSASQQKLFDSPTNGALTVSAGVYSINAMLYVATMSATSGNAAFDIKGAGTATVESTLLQAIGIDNSTPLNAGAVSSTGTVTAATPASIVTAGTGTGLLVSVRGIIIVSASGTLIPSITLVTANAAVLQKNSHVSVTMIGHNGTTDVSVGAWT